MAIVEGYTCVWPVDSWSLQLWLGPQPRSQRTGRQATRWLGLAAVYHARVAGRRADLRFDLSNLTDVRYAISDSRNFEGGWTRFGQGRAILVGIEQGF